VDLFRERLTWFAGGCAIGMFSTLLILAACGALH
jgi:hypothetical protein